MGQMQENKTKIVSKAIVAIIALSMVLPGIFLIAGAKETENPFELSAPIEDTFYKQNDIIMLANAQFDVKTGPQNMARELVIDRYDDRVSGWYLVKFNDAIDEYWVASLKSIGAHIGNYVPYNTYMVKMSADTKEEVQNLPFVRSVSIYQPAFRVQPSLLQGVTLQPGLESADALKYISWTNLYDQAAIMGQGNDRTAVTIMIHDGENAYDLAALIGKTGGKVLGITDNSVRAEISKQGIQALAFVNDVEYILPFFEHELMLADTAWTEQSKVSGSTPVWAAGIHGEGIVVGIADTGLNTDHDHFRQTGYTPSDWTGSSLTHRKVVGYHQLGDNKVDYYGAGGDPGSGHGSHVTGIAVGNGDYVGSTNTNRFGMAYQAKVSFCDIGKSDDGTGTNDLTLGGIPQDLKTMYALQKGDGASLSSNSWGVSVSYDTDGDGVDDARTYSEGTYSEDSLNSDWYMWQNKEFLIFFSNGNDRGANTYGGPAYNSTTTPPATGKNIVSVGAHQPGTSWQTSMTFSSWGPTLDGRLKPDVSATGVEDSASADSNRDGAADTTYVSMQGTSMSSPAALGDSALIAQYFREGWAITGTKVASNAFVPSNALIKAALLNGAKDTGTATALYDYKLNGHTMDYPNGDAGWGAVDTGDSLYFSGDSREVWYEDNKAGLITGQEREYKVSVVAGTPLEITLVWTDFPGTVATWGALVNDLDLTVIGPTGTVYYGNNFGATSRQSDSTNPAGYDHVNPVEGVLINTPTAGTYTIKVNANSIPKGPQPFGLVAAANFDAGYGWVKTDKMVYKAGDTMTIEIQDTTDGTSKSVTITSSTGDVETKTGITESAAGSRRFVTTIPVNALTPNPGNGAISIENDGWISVKYTDATPAHDSYANVTTLLSSPTVSNVYVSDISNTAAIVHWTTDVPATSQVFYGTTTSLGSQTTLDSDMVLTHDVVITNLNGFTNYYFDVQSVSIGGVTTRDSNGGSHYMFTTVDNPDVLIIQEHSDIESSAQQVDDWELSLGYYGWSFTVWETIKYGLPTLAAMNSAKVCYWDVGEGYPQLGTTERALVQSWLGQAGQQKWYMTGQDVGWDMCDAAGTDRDVTWYQNYLKATFLQDDADGGGGNEVGSFDIVRTTHPISATFGKTSQDLEQDIYGSARFWPDDISRGTGAQNPSGWDYSAHDAGGNTGSIAYDGADYKLAYEAFAHAMIQNDNTFGTAGNVFGTHLNAERAWIADSTIKWLMGEDHPDVEVTYPNGGENLAGSVTITWTIANAASQQVQISTDGGQSYVIEATGLAGSATSYSWNTAKQSGGIPVYPNGENYKVKILAQGTNLKAFDSSDLVFTVNNGAVGDEFGPVIVAGSIKVDPLPGGQGNWITFEAQADDRNKGNSNIGSAQFNIDGGAWQNMVASDGTFDEKFEDIEGYWQANIAQGSHTVNIRATDQYGNIGGTESFTFNINEGGPTVIVKSFETPNQVVSGNYNILWSAADYTDAANTLDCKIEYSANGGNTWTTLEDLTNNNDGTYTWNTASVSDGTNYMVRVSATDSFPITGDDLCNYTFSVDNTLNDRWYLQVQPVGANYALNMMPVDVTTNTKATAALAATGDFMVGKWQTDALTGTSIAGDWDFAIYGAISNTPLGGTGYMYAKVYRATGPTLLDTTVNDNENIYSFTSPHMFAWTDTLAGTFTSGDSLIVEIWVQVTAAGKVGSGTPTYDLSGTHSHTARRGDVNEAPYVTVNGWTDVTAQAALDASDNTRYTCADPGNGDYNVLEYNMQLGEAPSEITQIELHFEGYSSRSGTVNIYARNQAAGSWTFVAGATTTSGTDSTITGVLSGVTWANYVTGVNNLFTWMAQDMTADAIGQTTTLNVDYMRATVTWSAPAPTFAVHFDYLGAQSYVDPTIGGGGSPPYTISLSGKTAGQWVFVSFPSALSGNIQTILNDATAGDGLTTWDVAKWYNGQTKAWTSYRATGTQTLTTISNQMGVWLHLTANGGDQVLTLSSYAANPAAAVNINLYTGWNMVGYPSATNRLASATLPAEADQVAVWSGTTPYITDSAPGSVTMSHGNAYWVRVTADCTWIVNP